MLQQQLTIIIITSSSSTTSITSFFRDSAACLGTEYRLVSDYSRDLISPSTVNQSAQKVNSSAKIDLENRI